RRGNGQRISVEVGAARTQVGVLDRLPRFGGASQSDIRARVEQGSAPQPLQVSDRQSTVEPRGSEGFSFAQPQSAVTRLTQPCRICQQGLENGLQFAGRTGDDLQYLGGRSLLLQRLAQIVGALAQLVQQPGVLDRDDGLCSEILQQLDLLLGEWTHFLAVDVNGAGQFALLEQGDDQQRARLGEFDRCFPQLSAVCRQRSEVRG